MRVIVERYTFDPATRTVFVPDLPRLEALVLITNVTAGVVVYSFADTAKGGTLAAGVLTLEYDTTAMGLGDKLQIVMEVSAPPVRVVDTAAPLLDDDGAAFTRDVQLGQLLGSQPLVVAGKVQVQACAAEITVRGVLGALGQALQIPVSGYPTVGVQITGTWTGTILWEGTTDGGTWLALSGVVPAGGLPIASTTASGSWIVGCAGCVAVRLRCSASMAGGATCVLVASNAVAPASEKVQAYGSQGALLSQRATTLEANTYDTNLATVLGVVSAVRPVPFVPVAPIAPAQLTAAQLLANPTRTSREPSIFPRLRVEAAGDQQMPFAQQPSTYEIRVVAPELLRVLEDISVRLNILGSALADAGIIAVPSDW